MTEPYEEAQHLPQKRQPLAILRETKLPLWVSLLLVVLLVVVFIWARVAIGAAEARLERERQALSAKFEADRAALLARLKDFTARQDEAAQRRFGTALAWAVRGELIRNNLDQVDQFFNALVRLQGVERVVLAAQDGKIVLASDKRWQGSDFSALYPAALLATAEVSVLPGAEGKRRLVAPVFGLSARLGTLVMDYTPPAAPTAP